MDGLHASHTRHHDFTSTNVTQMQPCFYNVDGRFRCRKPGLALRLEPGGWPGATGHRPANVSQQSSLPIQQIPRRIVQTGISFVASLASHALQMRTWWEHNPEYEYIFFGEEDAQTWVESHAAHQEAAAYRGLRIGASRADLFRVLFLKYEGGVYADIDMEAGRPLRELITAQASAVVTAHWNFEFLAFEPNHPIVVETARRITWNVQQQLAATAALLASPARSENVPARRIANGQHGSNNEPKDVKVSCVVLAAARRRSAVSQCVHDVTGPLTWLVAVHDVSRHAGCSLRPHHLRVDYRDAVCERAQGDAIRRTLQCTQTGKKLDAEVPGWDCAAVRHWDCRYCRNVVCKRCSTTHHWTKTQIARQESSVARQASTFFHTAAEDQDAATTTTGGAGRLHAQT